METTERIKLLEKRNLVLGNHLCNKLNYMTKKRFLKQISDTEKEIEELEKTLPKAVKFREKSIFG